MSSSDRTPTKSAYKLWIADHDDAGSPVDSAFVEAAYVLEPTLFSYRQSEIGCVSLTATLVQSSVNAASRASRLEQVVNPIGYLLRTFRRKVDRHLSNASRELPVETDFIEDLQSREETNNRVAELLENQILLRQVQEHMDSWTRQVLDMRNAGYSVEEIARDLDIPASRLSVRYFRGIARAVENLFHRRARKRQLKADAE